MKSSRKSPITIPSPLIISFGGGVNSTAMILALHQQCRIPHAILFADTGGESPATHAHLHGIIRPLLQRLAWPDITILRGSQNGEQTLEAACLRNAVLPAIAYGSKACSDHWKIRPQRRWIRTWPPAQVAWDHGIPVTFAIGYDAGETRRKPLDDTPHYAYIYPLRELGWDRDACIREIHNAGLPVPPKSSCFFCPSTTKADLLKLNQQHPNLTARACRIESLAFASGNATPPRGLGRTWSWSKFLAAHVRQEQHE